jgi:hypothetical protein
MLRFERCLFPHAARHTIGSRLAAPTASAHAASLPAKTFRWVTCR